MARRHRALALVGVGLLASSCSVLAGDRPGLGQPDRPLAREVVAQNGVGDAVPGSVRVLASGGDRAASWAAGTFDVLPELGAAPNPTCDFFWDWSNDPDGTGGGGGGSSCIGLADLEGHVVWQSGPGQWFSVVTGLTGPDIVEVEFTVDEESYRVATIEVPGQPGRFFAFDAGVPNLGLPVGLAEDGSVVCGEPDGPPCRPLDR